MTLFMTRRLRFSAAPALRSRALYTNEIPAFCRPYLKCTRIVISSGLDPDLETL